MQKILSTVGLLTLVALGGCAQPFSVDDGIISEWDEGPGGFTFLDQEWDAEERDEFYTTPQGNLIIPYKWFLNLETTESNGNPRFLFSGDDNIEKLRYLTGHKTDRNKDRLPVGFTKEKYDSDRWGVDGEEKWLGMNCAACHTNQINYTQKINGENDKKYQIRIDGAPTMADFIGFLEDLNRALRVTMMPGPKFDRFADEIGDENLREKMKKVLAIREGWTGRNSPRYWDQERNAWLIPEFVGGEPTVRDGNARLDAFGSIFNEAEFAASGLEPDDHDEIFKPERVRRRRTNAPVSYPFLWGTRWHDWVQWPANAPRIPMARNFTQVVGVFGRIDTTEKGLLSSYESSMRLENLRNLANMIENLRSPQWPEGIFGPIDKSPRSPWTKGEQLFGEHCIMCHEVVKRDEPQRRIEVNLSELADLGTDPVMVRNFLNRKVDPGVLQGRGSFDSLPVSRLKAKDEATAKDLIGHFVTRSVSDDFFELIRLFIDGVNGKNEQVEIEIYKGRPLEGIWATAPYLHNGSVPTLEELMKLPDERVPEFWVGSREFLPDEVGFKYLGPNEAGDEDKDKVIDNLEEKRDCRPISEEEERCYLFRFDTTIPGNGNGGHAYPDPSVTVLSEEDRKALVVYQKSL